ncbi:MAG: hypothetical protein D3917_15585, partial [Candidatus Electrothrix sp. AX5]|nr:hypothetical protein [Candidatus Electrothrix sp. AX5]
MINREVIESFTDNCKPRILVVTDMSFSEGEAFSLSQFVNTLLKAGMEVTRAQLKQDITGEPEGTLPDFNFDNAESGLSRERYDVCFIFPFSRDGSWRRPPVMLLPDEDVNAIEKFMEEGGGVFATGDHEDLGAGICRNIIRVRNMRKWTRDDDTPSGNLSDRLSTMLSGIDDAYEFADESDSYPQRVTLNRNTVAGGAGSPHPLMQAKNGRAIVHIPDHPHEGECIIPENLEETFQLDGEERREWPLEIDGDNPISPEVVAISDSMGGPLEFPITKNTQT